MKKLRIGIVIALVFALSSTPSWAATVVATVSATVPSVATIALARDMNSVTRGSPSQVLFDKRDDQDRPGRGEASFMYASYESETNKNWHVTSIAANGSTMSLSASVSGTIGTVPLANILRVWCIGFFPTGEGSIPGTPSTAWELANGFRRNLSRAFIGVVPFKYQLNISGIAAGGPYTGTITFSLTTT